MENFANLSTQYIEYLLNKDYPKMVVEQRNINDVKIGDYIMNGCNSFFKVDSITHTKNTVVLGFYCNIYDKKCFKTYKKTAMPKLIVGAIWLKGSLESEEKWYEKI